MKVFYNQTVAQLETENIYLKNRVDALLDVIHSQETSLKNLESINKSNELQQVDWSNNLKFAKIFFVLLKIFFFRWYLINTVHTCIKINAKKIIFF